MWPKLYSTFLLVSTLSVALHSQTIINPNYGLKSHKTLEATKIEVSAEKTVVHLTIENRIEKGNFCADKNIYLIDPSGLRMKLLKASGIPVCPESYRFKAVGEKLNFILTFPPLKTGTLYIDLKEECSENCFSFYGIVLDKNLNSELDEAFSLAESGQALKALDKFISLAETYINSIGLEPLLYFNIIRLATETGNSVIAGEWYKKLSSPGFHNGNIYIEQLKVLGIRY